MGLSNVDARFSSIGVPGFLAYVVAVLELAGGIMLIVGLFTRYVSALFVVMLVGAIVTAKLSVDFSATGKWRATSWTLRLLITLYLAAANDTSLSIDRLMNNKRSA